MKASSILLLIFFFLTLISSFLLIQLNESIISIDFLFSTLEIELGVGLLLFFLSGIALTLLLEILYRFSKPKPKSDE
tara:strand:+ start:3574 stop:3804 length:231 start_codon:yes stop_codon:yes gene_type:complete